MYKNIIHIFIFNKLKIIIFLFLNNNIFCCCCCNNNNDNDKKEQFITDNKDNKDNNLKENGKNYFYADGNNCGFITAILDLMVIFDYFPELFEDFKNTDNLVKNNNVADKFKIDIINEIVYIRTKYLNNETGIDTHKLFKLLLKFIEELIHNFTYEYYVANQDFYKRNNIGTALLYNFKKEEYQEILSSIFYCEGITEKKFNDLNIYIKDFKFSNVTYNFYAELSDLIDFINYNILKFCEIKVTKKKYTFFNKNNNYLFTIDFNIDNINDAFIINLDIKNSINKMHRCNIIKKNNKFYLYSDNYYIECDENDITNRDFHKILNTYNKIGHYSFKKPSTYNYFFI